MVGRTVGWFISARRALTLLDQGDLGRHAVRRSLCRSTGVAAVALSALPAGLFLEDAAQVLMAMVGGKW
jgi:hypothetical protein